MNLVSCGKLTSEKYFVRLDCLEIKDRDNSYFELQDGQELFPLSIYNELLERKNEKLKSLYPHVQIKQASLFEYKGNNVELKQVFNIDKEFVCHAWMYSPDYNMPEYKFSKNFGELINP